MLSFPDEVFEAAKRVRDIMIDGSACPVAEPGSCTGRMLMLRVHSPITTVQTLATNEVARVRWKPLVWIRTSQNGASEVACE